MNIDPLGKQLLDADPTKNAPKGQQVPSLSLRNLLQQLVTAASKIAEGGTTGQRPNDPVLYELYFDSTLGSFVYASAVRVGATPAVWTPLGAGGSGTVTSVSGTVPIVITGAPTVTPNVTVTDFVASGASHARGTVPDPGASAATTHFLREDATWAIPSGGVGGSYYFASTFGA